jgi:hypothetical protein
MGWRGITDCTTWDWDWTRIAGEIYFQMGKRVYAG